MATISPADLASTARDPLVALRRPAGVALFARGVAA